MIIVWPSTPSILNQIQTSPPSPIIRSISRSRVFCLTSPSLICSSTWDLRVSFTSDRWGLSSYIFFKKFGDFTKCSYLCSRQPICCPTEVRLTAINWEWSVSLRLSRSCELPYGSEAEHHCPWGREGTSEWSVVRRPAFEGKMPIVLDVRAGGERRCFVETKVVQESVLWTHWNTLHTCIII